MNDKNVEILKVLKRMDDPDFSVEEFYSEKNSLEEKISSSLVLLSSIDGIPKVEQLLNSIKLQKNNILAIYDLLSSSIRSDLVNNLDELFELKLDGAKLEKKMDSLLYSIRVSSPFSSNSGGKEFTKSDEYRQFLSMYNDNISITQKVVKLKSKISLLLDSQKVLDKNYSSKMAHIDYQIISLGKIISNLHEASKEEVGELYSTQFNKLDLLVSDVTEREDRFDKLRKMMNLSPENFVYQGFNKGISSQLDNLDFLYKGKDNLEE